MYLPFLYEVINILTDYILNKNKSRVISLNSLLIIFHFVVPRFPTNFIKHFLRYVVLWNIILVTLADLNGPVIKELNFNCLSVQSVPKRLSKFRI